MQPSLVILNLGLSDPRHLHHATQVQPQHKNKVMVRCTRGKVNTMFAFTPEISPLGLSPRNTGDNVATGTSDWEVITVKLAVQNRQTQIRWFPLPLPCSPEPSGSHGEPGRSRKTLNTKETSPFMRLSTVLDKMQHCLAREFSGTLEEIPGTVQSVGCSVDGCLPVTS